ncbi:MAG: hypothetical protein ACJ8ER_03355 [Allosphingosinicella sp.]
MTGKEWTDLFYMTISLLAVGGAISGAVILSRIRRRARRKRRGRSHRINLFEPQAPGAAED